MSSNTAQLSYEADRMPEPVIHEPVLLRESLELLAPAAGAVMVDGTLGTGGHTLALLEAVGPQGRVIGIDRDPEALASAQQRLREHGDRLLTIHGRHEEIGPLLRQAGISAVDGILFDFGVSSLQLDSTRRGFRFSSDGPLDMRMDPHSGTPTAADLLASVERDELIRILREYGEERRAPAIAGAILRQREGEPLRSTAQLAEIVERALGPSAKRFRIHPATRTFQALRIAVNGEIDGLQALVPEAISLLRPGGRAAFISYHSLEDRAIKHGLRDLEQRCVCPPRLPRCACGRKALIRRLTRRAIRPTDDETQRNPRARSARLRGAEKLS